ncbi:MAG: acetolactate synthase small subunit [Clostridia bacterium]|nr:acetolactate synthase small subunit [Clostridia bacterium]MBQ4609580.1 acetolactate synthase small subunit [Clostridia bacterium]MBQ7052631.1 acetolactate synthase small subunit [Clostridia bacterium]
MYINKDDQQRYTVGVLVDNEPGVLSRVSGLFFRRGFNIDSLAVGTTQDPEVSRITIVVRGDEQKIEQLVQQLYKLICVQKVQVMKPRNSVERQLLLVKVKAGVAEREGLMRLVDIFKAKVLDVTKNSMVLQITGENDKIESLMHLLGDYGILELVRTGVVALERGDDVMTSDIFD